MLLLLAQSIKGITTSPDQRSHDGNGISIYSVRDQAVPFLGDQGSKFVTLLELRIRKLGTKIGISGEKKNIPRYDPEINRVPIEVGTGLCYGGPLPWNSMEHLFTKQQVAINDQNRLRVASNFGDSGEIHARARKWAPARRRATRRGAEN